MGWIKRCFSNFSRRLKQLTPKKIFLFILCVVLLVIPTVVSLIYVYRIDHTYHTNHFAVTLYDPNGVELTHQEGIPENATPGSVLDLFYQFHLQKKVITEPHGDPDSDPYIIAKTRSNGISAHLKCYFSMSSAEGYCIDQSGNIFSIPEKINQRFLDNSHSELFYEAAISPALITIDNDHVTPSSVEWNYRTLAGNYLSATKNDLTQDVRLYEITGALDLRFQTEPDYCSVSVYKNEVLLTRCGLAELASLPVDTENRLRLEIQALWRQADHPTAYGTIQYNFVVQVRNPSDFFVSAETIPTGGFALLRCTNISNLSKIEFRSDPDYLSPTFHQEGKTAFGILAIPRDMTEEKVSFTIAYGASSQSFTLSIVPTEVTSCTKALLNTSTSAALKDEAKQDFLSLVRTLPDSASTPIYFRGNFLDPAENGFDVGYTHHSSLRWGNYINQTILTVGTEFTTSNKNGENVPALNNGVVIYTGSCTLLGNFLVIDHGCGVKLWYGHLSNFNVEVGEIVQTGQSLGTTGIGGVASAHGFLLVATVNHVIVDPVHILGKELKFQ